MNESSLTAGNDQELRPAGPTDTLPPDAAPLWKTLNAPFVIWLLSAASLAAAVYLHDKWHWQHQSEQRVSDNRQKLALEISLRMQSLTQDLGRRQQFIDGLKNMAPDERDVLVHVLGQSIWPTDLRIGLPEYADRPLTSPIWELRSLEPPDRNQTLGGEQQRGRQ
jgi:hypothetical protein